MERGPSLEADSGVFRLREEAYQRGKQEGTTEQRLKQLEECIPAMEASLKSIQQTLQDLNSWRTKLMFGLALLALIMGLNPQASVLGTLIKAVLGLLSK